VACEFHVAVKLTAIHCLFIYLLKLLAFAWISAVYVIVNSLSICII